ncbi:MAG: hypothetical protein GX112_11980 [Clostridiaceae bacterium]|nr:hypothetical protein [Clostridiaceae bacterium]
MLQQMNEVFEYIDLRNQTHSTYNKLLRLDQRDYPEIAVREALLNALVHRDYAYSDSTLVSIYDDRIEFVSLGGLLPGISINDIMLGVSACRNPKLAYVFYRLALIEIYGTGMQKIMNAYTASGRTPQIRTTDHAFKIILPNLNANRPLVLRDREMSEDERAVLDLARTQGKIARRDVETLLDTSQTSAGRLLRQMAEAGSLLQQGRGKNTRYLIPQ